MFHFSHVFAQHLYDGESDEFYLAEIRMTLQDGKLVDANGTLAGAYLAMDQALQYVVNNLGVPISDASKALESQSDRGMTKPNYRASFALLDKNFRSSP